MNEFFIGDRAIGAMHSPLIIAEIGINHEGSIDLAIAMADAAIEAGAEVIKHQTHIIEDEMSEEAKDIIPGNADVSIYEIMSRCALSEAEELLLMKHIQSKDRIFISTPFSRKAADRLKKFDIPAYKIGSGECNNYPLIRYIAAFGKPMIISTGMNDIASIMPTVDILRMAKIPYSLLHCTNVYPTPPELVRLGALVQLQDAFPDAVIGLSDHTTSNHACFGAVALGASILERHFTDKLDRPGPDIVCSMDPRQLKDLIVGSEILQKARGGNKGAVKEELPTIAFAFASVVAIKNISKGQVLTLENIWLKRPGDGEFGAKDFDCLIGRRAAVDIKSGTQIKSADLGS